jgi:solute carrier family 35, member F5
MTGRTTPAIPVESNDKSSRYFLGLCFIVLQCTVWIAAAILTQHVYEGDYGTPPFLLTYAGISLLSLSLPVHFARERLLRRWSETHPDHEEEGAATELASVQSMDTVDVQYAQANTCTDYVDLAAASACQLSTDHVKTWNHRRHITAALFLSPGMFFADYYFNKSLASTSVASCTVLVSTQSIFVYIMAVFCKLEHFSMAKLIAVIAGVVGTALTALDDFKQDDTENSLSTGVIVGDLYALIAAFMFAAYTIQVRLYCPENEELYSMSLLLGYIGAICCVLMSPLGLYHIYELEDWSWTIILIIIAKGLLDFAVTDYCMFRAIVLTNATISTVGLGLTIPMAFIADGVMGKLGTVSHLGILGAFAIALGFLVVNLVPDKDPEHEVEYDTTQTTPQTQSQRQLQKQLETF